jgi:transposase InsO family protein
MGRPGNVRAMPLLRFLKTECVSRKSYLTRDEAQAKMLDYIERFYNPHHGHSTLDHESSIAFEAKVPVA